MKRAAGKKKKILWKAEASKSRIWKLPCNDPDSYLDNSTRADAFDNGLFVRPCESFEIKTTEARADVLEFIQDLAVVNGKMILGLPMKV